MTFYRKYRPQVIDELDLETVRKSFKKLSSNLDNLPHAFLFAGPRGSGKTSSARILAKLVNCENLKKVKDADVEYLEPCNECDQCNSINNGSSIDIIEMDAASNRGIDDIRSLRESVGLAPSIANKKVYIIDEAHMLTTEAANAFLKTLEEPPAHVMFILATTDPDKLPITVRSRLTKIGFRKANATEIKRQLKRVASQENLDIDEKILNKIIENSDGSFRDAVKSLEDFSMGVAVSDSEFNLNLFVENLANKKCSECLTDLINYSDNNGSEKILLSKLISKFRKALYVVNGIEEGPDYDLSKSEIIKMLEILIEAQSQMRRSSNSIVAIEIAVSKWCLDETEVVKKKPKKNSSKKIEKKATKKIDLNKESWTEILNQMREKNASIEALLRAAKPLGLEGNTLNVGVFYRFHKERLDNNALRKTLEDVCGDVLGLDPLKVVCSLTERDKPLPKRNDPPLQMVQEATVVQAAKEVFG